MVPLPAAAVRFSGHTIVDRSELSCCSAGPRRVGREQAASGWVSTLAGSVPCSVQRASGAQARWGTSVILALSWPSAGVSFLSASLPTRP